MLLPMLYAERKRLAAIAELEAAGESLWTEELGTPVRVKIASAWTEFSANQYGSGFNDRVRSLLTIGLGMQNPSTRPDDWIRETDLDYSLSVLEAVYQALKEFNLHEEIFEGWTNRVFNEHRIAFKMIEGQVVPFESDELHTEVVEPALRLLVTTRFADAHESYLKALREISSDDPADAITDAGTALQSTLTTLGCDGSSLGPLIKSARKKGLLAPHDQTLADGIEKMLHWASADRSEKGDGHKVTNATHGDAWLAVHVVGALIVRLADDSPRATSD